MTWEWSHTPEAYDAARENLHRLDHEISDDKETKA